ncbi:DUF5000 domain-containing lipoprotein [uncultured Proteiniphilum sp.]|jgi:hypothetical protein|uniref:DUF5000 domain-containing lipoprotein n=1 Tax=uncultured Proteiniphilum sp. TaxID=497637 RepID=UPI00261949B5|nr:DUF5000 domain-containing lipoprotein [uncultured Proteiniphilum sp.]
MKMYLFILLIASLFFFSCDEDVMSPINRDTAPLPVSNVQVENFPGAAKITYDIPKDKNLLYVKAVYRIAGNVEREVKSSYLQNFLFIDGFPNSGNYKVELYTVSRGEHFSEPVTVTVNPLTPPFMKVFESLQIDETFGGMRVRFENESEASIVLQVLAADSTNNLVEVDAYYTKRKNGSFSVRGFEPIKNIFGIFVRDRWNNYSDTLLVELTPLFEQKLDKSLFKHVALKTDYYKHHQHWDITKLWNGNYNHHDDIFCTSPGHGLPQWFTFDLGVTATLSRFKLHSRNAGLTDGSYNGGDPKMFEIYGSNNPDPDGGWENWTLLRSCESIKPSGLPVGQITSEDKQFAEVDGQEFEFPFGIPPVRYIRFKTIKLWGLIDYVYISELTFWGSIVENEKQSK